MNNLNGFLSLKPREVQITKIVLMVRCR